MSEENRKRLVRELCESGTIDSRYTNFECINYDSETGKKKGGGGMQSLIFKAYDMLDERYVFVKFFDPIKMGNSYRLDSFRRESELLESLLGKNRCLQLIQSCSDFELKLNGENGITLPYPYFITEWLDSGIEGYFESKNPDVVDQLKLFHDLILAVNALHRNGLFHRDLKEDNFRIRDEEKRIIIATDLGTAAKFYSQPIRESYEDSVGYNVYAAPEANIGFAGNRTVARYTDFYALGAMLYEMFSYEYFYDMINKNDQLEIMLQYICAKLSTADSEEKKLTLYNKEIKKFKHAIDYPSFNDPSVSVPKVLVELLDRILLGLTNVDYTERFESLDHVRHLVMKCIKILEHEAWQKRITKRKRILREKKLGEMYSKIGNSQSILPRGYKDD